MAIAATNATTQDTVQWVSSYIRRARILARAIGLAQTFRIPEGGSVNSKVIISCAVTGACGLRKQR